MKILNKKFLEKLFAHDFKENNNIQIIIEYLKGEIEGQSDLSKKVVTNEVNNSREIVRDRPMISKFKSESIIRPINIYDNVKIVFSEDLNKFIVSKVGGFMGNNEIKLDYNLLLEFLKFKKE